MNQRLDDVMVFGQHGSLVQIRVNDHTKCGSYMNDLGKICSVRGEARKVMLRLYRTLQIAEQSIPLLDQH